jgi:hypothetical protein
MQQVSTIEDTLMTFDLVGGARAPGPVLQYGISPNGCGVPSAFEQHARRSTLGVLKRTLDDRASGSLRLPNAATPRYPVMIK